MIKLKLNIISFIRLNLKLFPLFLYRLQGVNYGNRGLGSFGMKLLKAVTSIHAIKKLIHFVKYFSSKKKKKVFYEMTKILMIYAVCIYLDVYLLIYCIRKFLIDLMNVVSESCLNSKYLVCSLVFKCT